MSNQSGSTCPRNQKRGFARGFSLVELLVVIGLIAMLISLLMPVLGKARSAARATVCLSNLRQMGTAWTMYTSEHRGRLLEYQFQNNPQPDVAYRGYWLGTLDNYKVRGDALLCPSALEPIPYNYNKGYGNVNYAWNGLYAASSTVVHFSNKPTVIYRVGSYGYNRNLTAGGGYGSDGKATQLTSVKPLIDVPVFFDCAFIDASPDVGNDFAPAKMPTNLRGDGMTLASPDQFKFLIARHGRGINFYLADGSARWVPLEDTYLLQWKSGWNKYRLTLPR